MQIVSLGDNLHEMSKPIFGKKKKEKYLKMASSGDNLHETSKPIFWKKK